MRLGEKLRYLREVEGTLRGYEREMTQQEIVRAIKKEIGASISQSYLSQIENGQRPHLTNATRMLLARFFRVHPGYLVDDPEGYHDELLSELQEPAMELPERVAKLVQANLNDMIARAEKPEKMLKQVIIDIQNQFLQVKTQVAIAIVGQHVLEKKQQENEEKAAEWERRAELPVEKQQDNLARVALERAVSCRDLEQGFAEQVLDQKTQVENLKSALQKLQMKLEEAQSKSELLLAQHRRSRAVARAADAQMASGDGSKAAAFDRMKTRVMHGEAISMAKAEMVTDNVDDRLAKLEKNDKIEHLLLAIKTKKRLPA
jgi:phage shock protein A